MTTELNVTQAATVMTPQQYGVGARFTLSVYDSDYVRIILDALAAADASELEVSTNDISTFVSGSEQRIIEYLCQVISGAAASGAHISAAVLLSRGCPGELQCELPAGVAAVGAAPVQLGRIGQRARAHWSLYPLLDGGGVAEASGTDGDAVVDHMEPIYTAIDDAKRLGVFSGSDHFATRLDGDLADVLATVANAWIAVGARVQHVATHVTISMNSPTKIRD